MQLHYFVGHFLGLLGSCQVPFALFPFLVDLFHLYLYFCNGRPQRLLTL